MATLKRQISYYSSILLGFYGLKTTIEESRLLEFQMVIKKFHRRIWKWLSVCAIEIHREIVESLDVLKVEENLKVSPD